LPRSAAGGVCQKKVVDVRAMTRSVAASYQLANHRKEVLHIPRVDPFLTERIGVATTQPAAASWDTPPVFFFAIIRAISGTETALSGQMPLHVVGRGPAAAGRCLPSRIRLGLKQLVRDRRV